MWKHLSVENSLEPWCIHPVDESRKLRMCSDFPHLIKCLRNNLIQKKKFRIPEGWVLFSNFENLVQYEMNKIFKMTFKLTESHIHPNNGEKMNTRLAYQLFSNTTALALRAYQSKNIHIFGNVDMAITFCQRLNRLIDIMNSSKPDTGLKLDSQEYEDLNTFLIYLDLWKQSSPVENFLSESTYEGLKATISCTLDLTQYLSKLGFKYVMTSRLNQDHLEKGIQTMRYPTPLMALLALGYYTSLASGFHMSLQRPEADHDDEILFREGNDDHNPLSTNELRDEELEQAIDILRKLLILPWPNGESPLLYVENNNGPQRQANAIFKDPAMGEDEHINPAPIKRMRYYRKYPWKRQNIKYDPDSRFVCTPTKDEVHRLLVALHESRYGNRELAVDFCNRKRPAYTVFTNIRYLGK